MRDRAWRRWRRDVKFNKIFNHANSLHMKSWNPFSTVSSRYRRDFKYNKKNSISETIEVTVLSPSHFDEWIQHDAKMKRDNPKMCSCWMCGNPRLGNSKADKSKQELKSIKHIKEDMEDSDIKNMPNFSWRKFK